MNTIKVNSQKVERRERQDRRSFELSGTVPVIDIKGKIIQRDRRFIPDRRVGNIAVTEFGIDLHDEIFK